MDHMAYGGAWFSASLLPFLLFVVPLLVVFAFILQRKGRTPWLCLLVLIPIVGWLYVMYVVSLTDKDVLDRLERAERSA